MIEGQCNYLGTVTVTVTIGIKSPSAHETIIATQLLESLSSLDTQLTEFPLRGNMCKYTAA